MATKADQIAEDGSADHSPFAQALLAHFQIPGLELSLFFRSVRDTVLRATGNRQEPFIFSSLGAEPFYFYPRPPNRPPVLAAIPPLEVRDSAGPTPLPIPQPTDPDQDPLIGAHHRAAAVRRGAGRGPAGHAGRGLRRRPLCRPRPTSRTARATGPVGTLDILVEDGRGGSVMGSLPITVLPSNRPPVVEAPRRLRIYTGALGIQPTRQTRMAIALTRDDPRLAPRHPCATAPRPCAAASGYSRRNCPSGLRARARLHRPCGQPAVQRR